MSEWNQPSSVCAVPDVNGESSRYAVGLQAPLCIRAPPSAHRTAGVGRCRAREMVTIKPMSRGGFSFLAGGMYVTPSNALCGDAAFVESSKTGMPAAASAWRGASGTPSDCKPRPAPDQHGPRRGKHTARVCEGGHIAENLEINGPKIMSKLPGRGASHGTAHAGWHSAVR